MRIGYMRPYQDDLNLENQTQMLTSFPCDIIVVEEHASAKRRTNLDHMMSTLKPNDTIVVSKLFAFADSTRHLVELLEVLDMKQAFIYSLKENIDTNKMRGDSFSDIVKHLVDFQSDVISEKTKRGLFEAKQKGNVPGRPRKADENVEKAILMYQSKKYTLAEIKEETGISKSTLYRYLEN
ncbi:recombinase family protein [Paenibacillus anaericanus]|uniref:Recombinase family protein n=1 Tax=Paenibacillus anaericanus TaxID=170367 RepID=A0A3S1BQY2_9BACL|nr:recombinase family protein [Paenibacillus anaericanus]RUT47574.1 recombinase family protein [Paenibacillus anaericanus]